MDCMLKISSTTFEGVEYKAVADQGNVLLALVAMACGL